jgi:hypothetical protein
VPRPETQLGKLACHIQGPRGFRAGSIEFSVPAKEKVHPEHKINEKGVIEDTLFG